MEFAYIDGEPIVPVVLHNDGAALLIECFVDSGADTTMIPFSFAKKLGFIEWTAEEIENARGVEGGSIPYFTREAKMMLGDEELTITVACALQDNVPFLMGRRDIFDRFSVCFNDRKEKIAFVRL